MTIKCRSSVYVLCVLVFASIGDSSAGQVSDDINSAVLAALEVQASAGSSDSLFSQAAAGIGLGPSMFITPIVSGVLGPNVQHLMQPLGNYLAAGDSARLEGYLTGAGDEHRPTVLLWKAKDAVTMAMEKADEAKAAAEGMKAAAEAAKEQAEAAVAEAQEVVAQAKAQKESLSSLKEDLAASKEDALALARSAAEEQAVAATGMLPIDPSELQALLQVADGGGDGAAHARARGVAAVAAAEVMQGQGNGQIASRAASGALSRADMAHAAVLLGRRAAAAASTALKAVEAAVADGKAAATTKAAALQAAASAAAMQVAAQNSALPPLEKEHMARIAAAAARVLRIGRDAAVTAHRAAAAQAARAVAFGRSVAAHAAIVSAAHALERTANGHDDSADAPDAAAGAHAQSASSGVGASGAGATVAAHASSQRIETPSRQHAAPLSFGGVSIESLSLLELRTHVTAHRNAQSAADADASHRAARQHAPLTAALDHSLAAAEQALTAADAGRVALASLLGDTALLPAREAHHAEARRAILLEASTHAAHSAAAPHSLPAGRTGVFHAAYLLSRASAALNTASSDVRQRVPYEYRTDADVADEELEIADAVARGRAYMQAVQGEEEAAAGAKFSSLLQLQASHLPHAATAANFASASADSEVASTDGATVSSLLEVTAAIAPSSSVDASSGAHAEVDAESSSFKAELLQDPEQGARAEAVLAAMLMPLGHRSVARWSRAAVAVDGAFAASGVPHINDYLDASAQTAFAETGAGAETSRHSRVHAGSSGDAPATAAARTGAFARFSSDADADADNLIAAGGHDAAAAAEAVARRKRTGKKAAHPRRKQYAESTKRYHKLGAASKKLFDKLSHSMTTALSTGVSTKLSAALTAALRERLVPLGIDYLSAELPRDLATALVPPLRTALARTLIETLERTLPQRVAGALDMLLTTSLARALTHTVAQTVTAAAVHASAGWALPACAHCLATGGGLVGAEGGPPAAHTGPVSGAAARGGGADGAAPPAASCDDVCWGGPAAHAAAQALADGGHAAAAYFSDYYLREAGFIGPDGKPLPLWPELPAEGGAAAGGKSGNGKK